MIKFFCNVFPINLSHHIGIVFTRYVHEDEKRKVKGSKGNCSKKLCSEDNEINKYDNK